MKPSALLRSLSSWMIPGRLLISSPAAVAPLPTRSRFDQLVTSELDTLLMMIREGDVSAGFTTSSLTFLIDALSASAAAQKIALDCLPKKNVRCGGSSRDDNDIERSALIINIIDEYLEEDSAQLLDACRDLSETVEVIRNYSQSLQVALHSLLVLIHGSRFPPPTTAALARASQVLDSCDQLSMETTMNMKRGNLLLSRSSRLSRSSSRHINTKKKLAHGKIIKTRSSPSPPPAAADHDQLGEILGGSSSIASTACQILRMALSTFKSKQRGFPTVQSRPTSSSSWSCSLHQLHKGLEEEMKKTRNSGGFLMLTELRETIMAAQHLRIQIKNHHHRHNNHNDQCLGVIVQELKTRCEALEQTIRPLDQKLDDLYKNLISLRMALLGILCQP